MILKFTKVELVNTESRFVLKRTSIGDTTLMNRKNAVTNQIYSYERERLKEGKSVFPDASYQTHHIFFENIGWDYSELEGARSHADANNRILIPFEQRNQTLWERLSWNTAESSFLAIANKGLQVVPYPIPIRATLEEWQTRKKTAMEKLLPSQEIMPLLSSMHNEETFQDIIAEEIKKSKLIGIHLYKLINPIEIVNLSRLRAINSKLKPNDLCALFVGFNAPRRLPKLDSVNSAFAYSTFGIDIFSPNQLSPSQMKAMLRDQKKLQEQLTWLYDSTQGGYSTNQDQEAWHEIGLIDLLLNKVPVAEALNKWQTIIWFSTKMEQDDFILLNGKLLSGINLVEYIRNEKSKWCVFWDRYGATAIG